MEFRLLGPVEAYVDGHSVDLGDRKHRLLLALLLYEEGRPVSTDWLIDRIWDELPEAPRQGFYKYRSQLRGYLNQAEPGAGDLIEGRGSYRMRVDRNAVDLYRFRDLSAEAQRLAGHDDKEAVRLFREALRQWSKEVVSPRGGEPLGDLTGRWVEGKRPALQEEYRNTLLACLEAELRLGRHSQLIPELVRINRADPLDQHVAGLLARAYYRDRRQAEALTVIEYTEERLAEELNVDLAKDLKDLAALILRKDPSLDPPVSAPEATTSAQAADDAEEKADAEGPREPGAGAVATGPQMYAWRNGVVHQSGADMHVYVTEPTPRSRPRCTPEHFSTGVLPRRRPRGGVELDDLRDP